MLFTLAELFPDDFEIGTRQRHFDRLWGTTAVREALERRQAGASEDWHTIADSWDGPVAAYWEIAQRHLLYQ
jgi:hypothetical protein